MRAVECGRQALCSPELRRAQTWMRSWLISLSIANVFLPSLILLGLHFVFVLGEETWIFLSSPLQPPGDFYL
jgi:hypothetical protein